MEDLIIEYIARLENVIESDIECALYDEANVLIDVVGDLKQIVEDSIVC